MKFTHTKLLLFSIVFLAIAACSQPDRPAVQADPLPSWNEGQIKTDILGFVSQALAEGGSQYIPEPDRIAGFDNDGTLWSEQPAYFQLFFAMDRVKAMAADHPEWQELAPFKYILEDDLEAFAATGMEGLMKVVMTTHAGETVEEFQADVASWLRTARHPRFDRPYTDLVYQPMLELIDYLHESGFKVFIVSGGGIEFMRVWTEEIYGIPRERVIGSTIRSGFSYEGGIPEIRRLPEFDFINDKEGKPVGINRHIGRKPVFCGGNSDGDLQMMQYTDSGEGPRFMLYVHHTDAEREWAYDRDSHIGHFDKALDEAREKGWSVVDMKADWKYVYPFTLP